MSRWLAAILVFSWLGAAAAQEPPPGQVQLLSFLAPVRAAADAAPKEAPVTISLQVGNISFIPAVCELAPRLREAFRDALAGAPIPAAADGTLDTAAAEPLLLAAANKALRQDVIQAVIVTPGTQPIAAGSGRSRASLLGCGKLQ